jgi:hypothetical protein
MQITDPVFKDRLEIKGHSHSAKKWALVIGIVLVIITGVSSAMVYFFPNTIQYVNKILSGTPTAQSPSTLPPEATQPVVTAHEGASAPQAPKLNTHETAAAATDNASPSDHLAEPAAPKAQPSTVPAKPMATSPVVTEPIAATAPAKPVATPSVRAEPVAVQAKPVAPSVPAPVTAPTEPSTDPKETVERLLAKGKKQIARTRLTSPKGDNAYETYQALLKIAPPKAQQVLDGIIDWYFKQGLRYIREKDWLAQPRRGNAYKMYQKLTKIAPEHQSTETLLSEIKDALNQRGEQQLKRDRLTRPKGNNAYATYQEMLTVGADSQSTQRFLETLVKRLLAQAEQQMEKRYYTTPKDDNAAETYQKILKISQDNAEAQNGINKIANRYRKSALLNKKLGRYTKSLRMIERGLRVAPDDPRLNQLKQEVIEELSR